jgi:hypothetical protein
VSSDDFKGRTLTISLKKLKEMLEKQKDSSTFGRRKISPLFQIFLNWASFIACGQQRGISQAAQGGKGGF